MSTRGAHGPRAALFASMLLIAVLPLGTGTSHAHSPAVYYAAKWPGGTALVPVAVPFSIGNTPDIAADRVVDGMAQWNSLSQTMRFRYDGEFLVNRTSSNCPFPGDNWVYQLVWDGAFGTLAYTEVCLNPTTGAALSFTITFDGGETWYNGFGDAPSTHIDVWSVASHEFGHATGWGQHLDDGGANPTLCVDDSTQHTMCRSYSPGTERMRTLEAHDIDTFETQY